MTHQIAHQPEPTDPGSIDLRHHDLAAPVVATERASNAAGQTPRTLGAPDDADAEVDENVFQVLARQARTRAPTELWITTVGGLLSAALVWWQHPDLSWLGAGFAATAAYGVWGLVDRAASTARDADATRQLTGLRDVTAIAGGAAALWAVLDFMAAALGNWHH